MAQSQQQVHYYLQFFSKHFSSQTIKSISQVFL